MHVGNATLEMNMNGKIEFNAHMNGVSSLTFFVIVTRFSLIFGASMWDALQGFYGGDANVVTFGFEHLDFAFWHSTLIFFLEGERSDS